MTAKAAAPEASAPSPTAGNGAKLFLTRDEIFAADDVQTEEVAVPEWGGPANPHATVLVRGMSGTERDAFETSLITGKGKDQTVSLKDIRAKLCARTICGPDKVRLFSDSDIEALGKKSAKALDRVFGVAQRLSGITDEDIADLEKNSKSAPSGGSSSN